MATTQPNVDTTSKRMTLIAMIMASGIVFLDGTVINVAGPAIEKDLKLGLAGLQWVVNGYTLTLASFIILGGSLGDIYGRKRIMLGGMIGFGITSMICGLAPGAELLIAARVFQGVAGAFIVPGSLAVITAVYTDEQERGQAIGSWSGWSGITSLIGPAVGGLLVDNLSWRWVFFLNVPMIAATIWLMLRYVPETRQDNPPKQLDWLGAVLTVIGLGGTTYAMIEGPNVGWGEPLVLAALGVGLVAVVLFFVVEARVPNPMMPLGLFRSRNFSGANLATLCVYSALSGSFFFLGLYIQSIMGYSAFLSGLTFLPVSILMLLFSPRFGKLAGKFGSRYFMAIGPVIYAVGLVVLLFLQPDSNLWLVVIPAALILGAGLCVTVAPLTSAVMSAVPSHNSGSASSVNNVVSRVAGLLAIAGLGIVVSSAYRAAADEQAARLPANLTGLFQEASKNPTEVRTLKNLPPEIFNTITASYTTAFHWVIICCAVLALLGGLVSFLLIRRTPEYKDKRQNLEVTAAEAKPLRSEA